jgi:predicted outer membrane protein
VLPAVRFVRWAVLASLLVATLVSIALAGRSPSSPQTLSSLIGGGTTQTPWGPLGPSDRELLIKVRQANLWEGPIGEQAAQRATSPAVREVGRKLGIEHAQLDAATRDVAQKLGVVLPTQPSDQQKVFINQISGASPANYDKTFVNVVRSAHGEMMPLVEGVRSGTQNELIRQFAIQGSEFIARHMVYLESTGLVNYSLFPPSTAPASRLISVGGYLVPVTLLLFAISVLVAAAMMRGLGRSRRRAKVTGGSTKGAVSADREGRGEGDRSAGRRRDPWRKDAEPRTVTTEELIAVLNPPAPKPAAPPTAKIPRQRATPQDRRRPRDHRPPKLRRTSGDRGW